MCGGSLSWRRHWFVQKFRISQNGSWNTARIITRSPYKTKKKNDETIPRISGYPSISRSGNMMIILWIFLGIPLFSHCHVVTSPGHSNRSTFCSLSKRLPPPTKKIGTFLGTLDWFQGEFRKTVDFLIKICVPAFLVPVQFWENRVDHWMFHDSSHTPSFGNDLHTSH